MLQNSSCMNSHVCTQAQALSNPSKDATERGVKFARAPFLWRLIRAAHVGHRVCRSECGNDEKLTICEVVTRLL